MNKRFEDRTRWLPMQYINDAGTPVPYVRLPEALKDVARHVTSIIYRVANHKEPL